MRNLYSDPQPKGTLSCLLSNKFTEVIWGTQILLNRVFRRFIQNHGLELIHISLIHSKSFRIGAIVRFHRRVRSLKLIPVAMEYWLVSLLDVCFSGVEKGWMKRLCFAVSLWIPNRKRNKQELWYIQIWNMGKIQRTDTSI